MHNSYQPFFVTCPFEASSKHEVIFWDSIDNCRAIKIDLQLLGLVSFMLSGFIERARERRQGLRKVALAIALVFFVVGLVVAIKAAPSNLIRVRPGILLAYALIAPPITFLLQAAELRLTAKAGGAVLPWKQAIEIVVYSRAATLLPIPGGFLTRVAALRAKGIPVARSSMIVLLFTGILGTVAFAYAGAWLIAEHLILGSGFLGIALVGTVICWELARRTLVPLNVIWEEVTLRFVVVMWETMTLLVAFTAVGVSVAVHQTAVLVVASFVGLVVNIVPSGIGIREGVVALLSPFVGIDPAVGFLAAAVTRVVGFTWLAVVAGALLIRQKS